MYFNDTIISFNSLNFLKANCSFLFYETIYQAKFGAYPWMAVILGKGNNYVGAGALISPYYVLTAAHKIKSWK